MKNCPGKGLKFIFHSFQSSPKNYRKNLKFCSDLTKNSYTLQILVTAELLKCHRNVTKIRNLVCGIPCDKILATAIMSHDEAVVVR
jgi:hypothetical protein